MAEVTSGNHLTVMVLDWREAQLMEFLFNNFLKVTPVGDEESARYWAIDSLFREFLG